MTQKKNRYHHHSHHSRTIILLLTLLGFYSITMLTIVESSAASEDVSAQSESLSISSSSSKDVPLESSEEYSEKKGPLLKFLLRPVNSNPLEHTNTDNNDGDNNDSNVSSESDSGEVYRFRREEQSSASPPPGGNSKVVTTNWGTYEEQAPVVVQSEARAFGDDEDEYEIDQYQAKDHHFNEYSKRINLNTISYEDYEDGRFEGRQFGGGYNSAEEQEHPDGYYRQKYYATTTKPLKQQPDDDDDDEDVSDHRQEKKPHYPSRSGPQRPQQGPYQPQRQEEESPANSLLGFVQKAKTFYDIFKAMNSAWKTVEEHYRKNGQGLFPEDLQNMNESTRIALNLPPTNTVRSKTTTITPKDEEKADQKQHDTTQEKDSYRSRRSSAEEASSHETTLSEEQSSSSTEYIQPSESDLETSASDSSSSTAVAEGRYIKGDPLKGYYDFVITEGSYKFWATFQVLTALLIIYSTIAAIYYSKVNPLVSDYDYIDYLGGGRSLSDDADFVDTDVPTGGASDSKTASKSRQRQQSSAGWFNWMPHAGHTLRFILESIDKGYEE